MDIRWVGKCGIDKSQADCHAKEGESARESEEEYLIWYILFIQEEIVFSACDWRQVHSAAMWQEERALGHLSR